LRVVGAVATRLDAARAGAVSVSVVVPVFNSAAGLDELHDRVAAALGTSGGPFSWELILVNDGSGDASWERIVSLSGEHAEVRGLDLTRNFGQHNALLAGAHSARHEVIVTLDDDLQDRPEEIPRLLEALTEGIDLVYGRPLVKRRSLYRRIATRAVRATVFVLSAGDIPLYIGGFRAFRASLLNGVDGAQGAHLAIDTPLARSAAVIAAVSVQHAPRRRGRSNYTLGKLVGHTLTELRSVCLPSARRPGRNPTYVIWRTTGGDPGLGQHGP
jgi:undecaprenyl-phosphate 4-deoxy-4-formamido-L-arabinose transferase